MIISRLIGFPISTIVFEKLFFFLLEFQIFMWMYCFRVDAYPTEESIWEGKKFRY